MSEIPKTPLLSRIVAAFLRGDVAVLLTISAVILGGASLGLTPREEEPQIVVPMADVLVSVPGLSAHEVEQQVTLRLEKLLYQIDGVEYVYSMTRAGQAIVTVRFYVGENREDSLTKLYDQVQSNVDQIPAAVAGWVVKPIEIDDVPIVNVTLWSERPDLYGDHELRRLAEQVENELQKIPNTNRVDVIGGRPRRIRVELKPGQLAARGTSALQVAEALRVSNVNVRAGEFEQQNEQFIVEAGTFVRDKWELENLVVQVSGGRPVYLKDVADVLDDAIEVDRYAWIGFGPAARNARDSKDRSARENKAPSHGAVESGRLYPAVHVAVGKKRGTNAVWVAEAVEARMAELADPLSETCMLPDGVWFRITRDYGETANDKVNELVEGLFVAVITVVGLIGLVIGWRAALVVALAIPVCYSVTLFVNLMAGYTINRVTLFALILSLGLLVDDPITDVENIARYFATRALPPRDTVLQAVQEVRPALIMSTLAIIASFAPLMFITGMMGPYMAPMAMNVPLTVVVSTLFSFTITPWLAMVTLRGKGERSAEEPEFDLTERPLYKISKGILGPITDRRWLAWLTLGLVLVLFFGVMAVPALRLVPLKMLPYDNKDEFLIVVDMPEGTTLEQTEAVTRRLGNYLAGVNEVRDYQLYVGLASPMDFNGMVRHYFLRRGPNVAEVRVNLAPKDERAQQSHAVLLRIRDDLTAIGDAAGANLKLVEVPPGPPVMSTITAEVYGPPDADYDALIAEARKVEARMLREPQVVDVDVSAEEDQTRLVFEVDQPKAALSSVSKQNVAKTLEVAIRGMRPTQLHVPGEVHPLEVELRLPRWARSAEENLREMYVRGEQGELVQIGALGRFRETFEDKTIHHKNLRRVVYVFGDVAGRPPADAIMDMELDRRPDGTPTTPSAAIRPAGERTWLSPGGRDPWSLRAGYRVDWAGEGEWKITLDVFRDLGIAFGVALLAIFVLLMFETGSRVIPLIIMLAIPLTAIGIMPGFWLLNVLVDRPIGPSGYPNPVFFTATAMIGMIGLAGIVVRNSVVLIDFIQHALADGLPFREAVIQSVAVRARPILLTAGTTLLANWVITLDPIFSGLAWAIIFGIFASTVFTLLVIPVVYWLLYGPKKGAEER